MAEASGLSIGQRAVHRRAVEAVIRGMPAVNYQMMYQASARLGGPGDNQIVYWPGPGDWRNQTLMPNPERIKLYPLSAADNPPDTVWVDASTGVFDAAIPYDLGFFEALHRMVQAEPFLHRDRVMIDQLRSVGTHRPIVRQDLATA